MINELQQAVYQHDPNIVSRGIAGEVILVPIRNNMADMDCIYTLNDTAARYWELTDGERTISEIHQKILDEYDISDPELEADLGELVETLVNIGALKRVEA